MLVVCCTAHLQEQWMLQFLYICSICKEIVTSIAPEDGRISPKHVELKEHK